MDKLWNPPILRSANSTAFRITAFEFDYPEGLEDRITVDAPELISVGDVRILPCTIRVPKPRCLVSTCVQNRVQ